MNKFFCKGDILDDNFIDELYENGIANDILEKDSGIVIITQFTSIQISELFSVNGYKIEILDSVLCEVKVCDNKVSEDDYEYDNYSLDYILDKISETGIQSLSESEYLFLKSYE